MATTHLSLSSNHIDRALALCEALKGAAHAESVALVDAQGRLICRTHPAFDIDEASLGALVAATMAAHQSLARLIGETHFPQVTHQGQKRGVHLCLLQRDAIWVLIYDSPVDGEHIGACVAEHKVQLNQLLDEAHTPQPNVLASASLQDIDNLLR